jgi:hypothetical protein
VRPPTTPSEPATLQRPDLEVLVAAPADPVPFVRHVQPEPGSAAARRPVPVPLRTTPEAEAPVDPDPAPVTDGEPLFTAVDVLPAPLERRGFLARLRSRT